MDVSVIVCTYNRAALLPAAIESILAQQAGSLRYELIVVDNNSPDDTREVVARYLDDPRCTVRYLFERQQGLSHARNAAIAAAAAPILAFTDDDVVVAPDWVAVIHRTFAARPDIACLGGKVLPRWQEEPPAWLTRDHWAPLALVDRGERQVEASDAVRLCFVGANLIVRKEVFDSVGLFAPRLQRVKDGIGSTEDHEFLLRVYATGRRGLYVPELVVHAEVQSERLTKAYHRRWHSGHGGFCALMHLVKPATGAATLFGVPSYFYRTVLEDVTRYAVSLLRGDRERRFINENAVRFGVNYLRMSRRMALQDGRSALAEFAGFVRGFVSARLRRERA
ncbi:glycosyltransferase [Piscinibacter koreensis]|uniref:Glycosyltransferase family 2 protein n=1 Tax=Piscinibacter koreensis TaxID=2742824 RepID=A0A7Y6NL45_9BURK|nr:glycosyltransferase [Schlegelella koreensis]NUZ05157.1 glycosyltransferase family 2 protein [Schlegelella koreensis]